MIIAGNVVLLIVVALLYVLFASLSPRFFFIRSNGVPGIRYREVMGSIDKLFVLIHEDNDRHFDYRAYAVTRFDAGGREIVSKPYLVASSTRFPELVSTIDQQLGKIPLSVQFFPPLKMPESVEQLIDGDSFFQQIAALEPRTQKKSQYPLLYDSSCPFLFAFKTDAEFKNNPWLYLLLLPVFGFSIFLLYILTGRLVPMQHMTQVAIAIGVFITAPVFGYFCPTPFVRFFQPDRVTGAMHVEVNDRFSKGEMIRQMDAILNKKR